VTPEDTPNSAGLPGLSDYPLFSRFSRLQAVVPRVPLGSWPTPVEPLGHLAGLLGIGDLRVKHDDVSAVPYGGNKVRKLEILLGDALAKGAHHVVTFGAAGSNHALATAIYARRLGLDATAFLMAQPNAHYVRRNLLAHRAVGGAVRMHTDRDVLMRDAATFRSEVAAETGVEPYVIPFGGTTPLSTVGVVNAGFEFALQVASGAAPAPDVVYIPLGSMGTAVGIALGLALGGLTPVVRAVRVVPASVTSAGSFDALAAGTMQILEAGDAAFPRALRSACRVELVDGFLGEDYARFTSEGMEAVRVSAAEGLHLEGTYTGKAMAALFAAARGGDLTGANVLFWDTYNSHDIDPLVAGIDYKDLPRECHVYFETDVQPLDGSEN
jgi:1-aminocyclopropane-1-carboxylate deaminase/D-cysteine desulfhydrase-like pyridoxal-dependent ACC family enzyme